VRSVVTVLLDLDPNDSDQTLLRKIVDFYHAKLKESRKWLELLEPLGLRDDALIEQFRLGCANRTLGLQLPPKGTRQRIAIRERLTAIGVYRPSGHEHLNGCLVVPIMEQGRVVQMYGRRLGSGLRASASTELFLPGPVPRFFNGDGVQGEVTVCGTILQALGRWLAGERNVVAMLREGDCVEDAVRDLGQRGQRVVGWGGRNADQAAQEPMAREEPGPQDELTFVFGDRRWRVRGLGKNTAPDVLRINLMVSRDGGRLHVDSLDLYVARQRVQFAKAAAAELDAQEAVLKKDLGGLLLQVEEAQQQLIHAALECDCRVVEITDEEREAALELLRDPRLVERVVEDLETLGLVGERSNKLVAYLATLSRKLDDPLAVVVQSSSAAGKSTLMDAVLRLVPEEDRVHYSAMTGQSLYYMGEQDLRHRILALSE
jgi:hypothetical protein